MILPLARMGDPILQTPADIVQDIHDPAVQDFIVDLTETFRALNGAGLAAPQVFKPWRIVVFHVPEERAKMRGHYEEIPFTVIINPTIEYLTDETTLAWEGCFSIPDMMGEVPRCKAVRYRGVSEKGEVIDRYAEGYYARMIQHELDHLEGILYPMRMTDMSRFGFVAEVRKALGTL